MGQSEACDVREILAVRKEIHRWGFPRSEDLPSLLSITLPSARQERVQGFYYSSSEEVTQELNIRRRQALYEEGREMDRMQTAVDDIRNPFVDARLGVMHEMLSSLPIALWEDEEISHFAVDFDYTRGIDNALDHLAKAHTLASQKPKDSSRARFLYQQYLDGDSTGVSLMFARYRGLLSYHDPARRAEDNFPEELYLPAYLLGTHFAMEYQSLIYPLTENLEAIG